MTNPDPIEGSLLGPAYEPKEREELNGLAFFLGEIARLRDRGLIADEAYKTIVDESTERRGVIERAGNYRAAIDQANRFRLSNPNVAADYADKARAVDPSRREAWELSVELYRKRGDRDKALSVCEEAAAKFADFPVSPETIRAENATITGIQDLLSQSRDALQAGDDASVIVLTDRLLGDQPEQFDAMVLQAFARQRGNDVEGALALYRKLMRREPENSVWRKWVKDLERRDAERRVFQPSKPNLGSKPLVGDDLELFPLVAQSIKSEPRTTWSEITGEFLQDHWQKLILCLAVLLIVVSSNVGAYQVLGERLWKPEGKCLLALVYTGMFAIFGAGLVRWGAERAGRMMLLTTLIVVPANFMLAGQMKLLTEPSTSRLAVLGVDAVALFLLIRLVATSLRLPRGSGFLSVALFALSVFNAGASQGSPWPWPLQFTIFLGPALLYLASIVWVTTGFQAGAFDDRRETTYFAIALLTFAFVTGLVRTGIFAMDLIPTLYAFPVMLLAVAGVRISRAMPLFDPEPQRIAWMKFAAVVVSGMGFTLALARPPELSPLFSGNTLAAAVVGLVLYSVLLWKERIPAYLYFAFGALFLAYFGVFYFVRDLAHAFEDAIKSVAGYQADQKLPAPFKAINGLVFNPLLAGLSLFFTRKWNDARLARHCHYIGVPFSIAACVFSGFEPKAALICLSGYALLYALAVRVFAAPWTTYLSTAALAGAVYFGASLTPGLTFAQQGLIASLIGLMYYSIVPILSWRNVPVEYRRPFIHSALGMSILATLVALSSTYQAQVVSIPAAITLLIVAGIAVLLNRDWRLPFLADYAVAAGNLGLIFLAIWAGSRWWHGLNPAEFSAACALIGFGGALLGNRLAYSGRGSDPSGPRLIFPAPLFRGALVQVGLTLLSIALHAGRYGEFLGRPDFLTLAFAFGFAGLTLALLTLPYPYQPVTNLGLACGLGVWVSGFQVVTGVVVPKFASYAAVVSIYSLLLIAIEELAQRFAERRTALTADATTRHSGLPELAPFAEALPWFEVGTVALAVGLCFIGLENSFPVVFTLAASALAMLWSTRLRPVAVRVDVANLLAVSAAFSFTAWLIPSDPRILSWLGITSVVVALGFLAAWRFCSQKSALGLYTKPFLNAASALTWLVFALAIAGGFNVVRAYPISAGGLALNVVPILLLAHYQRQARLTFRAIASAVVAVYVVVFSVGESRPEDAYVIGSVAVMLSLGLSLIGFVIRRRASLDIGLERLYVMPLFASSLLMATVGSIIAYKSPISMGLGALAFLLFVKGLFTREWLYATVICLVSALYHGVLIHGQESQLAVAGLMIGFGLWIVALIVQRTEPFLSSLLALPQEGYSGPLYNSALIAAFVGAWLRLRATQNGHLAATDSAALTLGFAAFAVLMIKPYPSKGWVHLALALATTSVGLAAYPKIGVDLWWLAIAMGISLAWLAVARGLEFRGAALCRFAGVPDQGYASVPQNWSRSLFGVTAALITLTVGSVLFATLFDVAAAPSPSRIRAWASLEIAVGLGAIYLFASWRKKDYSAVIMGLTWALVMAVWWLAAPISPLVVSRGMSASTFLPLATGVMSFAIVAAGVRFANRPGWAGPFWMRVPDLDPVSRLGAFSLQAGLGLALIAVILTRGTIGNATVGTLLLTTLAAGLAAMARKSVPAAYATGLSWTAACSYAVLDGVGKLDIVGSVNVAIFVALGMFVALAVLLIVAGLVRRNEPMPTDRTALELPARTVAVALEQVAALAWLISALCLLIPAMLLGHPDPRAAATAVGVLLGLTLAAIGFIARWRDERLVYPAHATLLGAYLYYRWAFPLPVATDAVVLTLFGYLDLGLADVMQRVGLGRYSKTTRYASLMMPMVPIALSIFGLWGADGVRLDDLHLFILFSAATFYAVACYSIEWRWLGYAAAVLYNAFLWFLWSRVGYTFSDSPQFFLIPVGLSAILFAEDNRRALGKDAVNAVRVVGLTLIYLSLAAPIWQVQSLWAWVTLLLLSLGGIFIGIGLRVQVFLWFGLVMFVMDVVYQLGRMGTLYSSAKVGIMLVLGILLILFVALNEKKSIVKSLKALYDDARAWE